MKPAPFRYFDPISIEDALALLGEWGEDARLLAGGQTLGPMLNLRLVTPGVLVDINGVSSLDFQRSTRDGLAVGALTRQAQLEDDPDLPSSQPLVAAAIPFIAHRAIRNRGTVGGSLAHADPAAEWGGLALALDATFRLRKRGAERAVAAKDFFCGLLETVTEPEEILVEINLPQWPEAAGWSFQEFSRRHGDFAIAGVACVLSVGREGIADDVRLAAFGVESAPSRLDVAEALLRGERFGPGLAKEAARRAADQVEPMDDRQGSADYRRHLVKVLVERALHEAASRHARPVH
jgi:aerobic carbon-monoxide dehydrogenase medium subunit